MFNSCFRAIILNQNITNQLQLQFFFIFGALYQRPRNAYKLTSNSSVFNWFLNERVFWTKRMETSSPFQAFGPATLKARSPNFSLVRFLAKERLDPDRRLRLSWNSEHGVTISFRYEGLRLFTMLCIIRQSLNLIRSCIGSQWRERSACVIWSLRLSVSTILAAVWRTHGEWL
jgi:hypothetical protein